MNKALVIQFLASCGVQFANEATEDQLSDALKQLGVKAQTLAAEKTQWANERTNLTATITARDGNIASLTSERDTFKTNFANERKARIKLLLDDAIAGARITAAERTDWERRLENEAQFANESEALGKLTKKLKTDSVTLEMGSRKVEIANAQDRRNAVSELVSAEMQKNGNDYDRAFAKVQRDNPALFEAMAQPEVKMPPK